MNLNEKCLLKYLTNPIGIINQGNEITTNVQKLNEHSFGNYDEHILLNVISFKVNPSKNFGEVCNFWNLILKIE